MNNINYKKASTYYFFGNIFNKGIAFLTVPIFTRILSTSDYGIITTYNSWIAILSMIFGFALHMGIRAAFIDYKDKIDEVMSTTTTFILLYSLILSIFIGASVLLIGISINITLIILCFLQSIATALIENYSMYLMMKYKYKFRTLLMILPNLISVIISIIVIIFVLNNALYLGRIIPTAVITSIFGVLIIYFIYRKSNVVFDKKYIKYTLKISAPLVIHGIALNILSQSDRTMITYFCDSAQTGIYSLVYNFSMIATVITTSLTGVWVPWFTEKMKERRIKEINELAIDYINLMTYCIIGIMLIGPEILKLLADSRYWEGIKIIPPVVLANYFIFAYTMYVNIEHYHKKTPFITLNTIIAAIINIILNFLLIPKYGYLAAAYTTVIAYTISFVLHARYAKKIEKQLYPLKFFVIPLIHITTSIILFYMFMDNAIARWFIIIIYILTMIFFNRKKILKYFPSIEKIFRRKK